MTYSLFAGLPYESRDTTLPPGWPDFAQRWLGGEFPSSRGLPAEPEHGWQCPGCRRGYSPKVMQCYHCPEPAAPAVTGSVSVNLTWNPDAGEPDES